MDKATGLPLEGEEISFSGFGGHVGPLYRLPHEGDRPRFGFRVEQKHMNSAGSVHGGMLMALADVAMSSYNSDGHGRRDLQHGWLDVRLPGAR